MAKVLIVEDDTFLRNVLEKRLKKEGFEVVTAVNGDEALQKIISELPDLVLLDIILPQKSGFLVLEEINKDPNLKTIPIFIISQLGQTEDIDKGMRLGAIEYIVKAKISLDELIEKIKNYFQQRAGSSSG